MKTIFKTVLLAAVGAVIFASCNKEDNSLLEQQQREIARIDSTNKAQATILKAYAEANFTGEPKLDTASGIYFEVLQENQDDSFNFFNSSWQVTNFNFTAKYEGRLVNNPTTQFDSNKNANGDNFSTSSPSGGVGLIEGWIRSIIPKSYTLNSREYFVGGITEDGVKKGGKIRVLLPSTLAYDNRAQGQIPANSPLDFTIEIVNITR